MASIYLCSSVVSMQGATALHMAAHKGCVDVVKGMVAVKQCEVNAVDNEGRTALHHAAAQGHVAVTQSLWSAKCNIEMADNHGWTGASILCARKDVPYAFQAVHVFAPCMCIFVGFGSQRLLSTNRLPSAKHNGLRSSQHSSFKRMKLL